MTAPTACNEPGCSGTIEDGYCNVCGTPGPAGAQAPGQAQPAAEVAPASSRMSSRTSSSRLASASIGSARGTRSTRRVGTSSTRLRLQRLGAGVTTVPPAPVADPLLSVLAHPEVAENKRYCPSCNAPVGRARGDRPGRTKGFCPACGGAFDFAPQLSAGDVVGGQYEVVGAIAHGGLGWIYLARDQNLQGRYVVLKGLLNTGDKDAYEAAVKERQFLAEVEHPLIVEIYNFAMYEGSGYTVMEYVGGRSLKQILKDRQAANGGQVSPLPVDQALAYILEILPAFSYLHDHELVFCDFKPDNLIQQGEGLKLIDLGGVRRISDNETDTAIFGTVGYQAPEVPTEGTTVASDIYTIGRTLVTLVIDFRGNTSTYVASLPAVADVPVFGRYDSFYRLVAKACAADPSDRFISADEMRTQVLGVLREVVAIDRPGAAAASTSAASANFEAPLFDGADDMLDWHELPRLKVDPSDPMATWLAGITGAANRREALSAAAEETVEVRLARIEAAIAAGDESATDAGVAELLATDPWEWRALWLHGLAQLAAGNPTAARASFNAVYGQVPGELAPKLALAVCCERSGELAIAEQLYLVCARTDANYAAPAAFGLARIRENHKDHAGAVGALDLVAATRSSYPLARVRRAEMLLGDATGLADLDAALGSIQNVPISDVRREELRMAVFSAALDRLLMPAAGQPVTGDQSVGGVAATEVDLRTALESACRARAKLADDPQERIELVDRANAVRPRTLT